MGPSLSRLGAFQVGNSPAGSTSPEYSGTKDLEARSLGMLKRTLGPYVNFDLPLLCTCGIGQNPSC